MQVLFPAAVIVLVPVHWFLAGKSCIFKDGKGQLALFSTKDNVLLTSHPSYSSAIDLFSLFYFLFFFLISIHYYVDPTLTLPSTFFSTTSLRGSLKVCWLCSFRRIQNGFLIRDLPDFAVERNVKSEIGFVTLVTFRTRVQYTWLPLKKWHVFYCLTCDYTAQNFVVGSSNKDDGT